MNKIIQFLFIQCMIYIKPTLKYFNFKIFRFLVQIKLYAQRPARAGAVIELHALQLLKLRDHIVVRNPRQTWHPFWQPMCLIYSGVRNLTWVCFFKLNCFTLAYEYLFKSIHCLNYITFVGLLLHKYYFRIIYYRMKLTHNVNNRFSAVR